MKTNLLRIISLLISAIMVFTLLCGCSSGCKEKEDTTANVSSENNDDDYQDDVDDSDEWDDSDESDESDDDESDDDESDDDESDDDESDDDESDDDDPDEEEPSDDPDDDDWDQEPWDDEDNQDTDADDNTSSEDPSDDEEEQEDEFEPDSFSFYDDMMIYNAQEPIITNYRGVSGSVYHAYGFMKNDRTGRVYTDEMMDLELSRLHDAGVRYCRTRYTSEWVWDYSLGNYNWNSERFNYFCDYAKTLAKQDTNVCLNFGWNFGEALGNGVTYIGEATYLHGDLLDDSKYTDKEQIGSSTRFDNWPEKHGESVGFNLSQYTDNYWKNLAIVGLRYGEFLAQSLIKMRELGIDNVTHVYWFTEPSYPDNGTPYYIGYEADEYIFVMDIIMQKLEQRGVRDWVKHIGPDQGSIYHGDGLLRYMLEAKGRTDLFDVLSAHCYPQGTSTVNNTYADLTYEIFASYVQPLKDVGIYNNEAGKEFWVDEFYCRSDEHKLGVSDAWAGLQNVVSFLMAQQYGIQNISLWQIFDQLWTDQTNTEGEFVNGIHSCGSAPSLFVSSIPKSQYYATSLFAKFNGSQNGTVYKTNNYDLSTSTGDVYIGCVKLEDGNYTVTLVNAHPADTAYVTVNFEEAINRTLYRHIETVTDLVPTTAAKIAGVDKTFVNVTDSFCDTIPAGSVVIYTTAKVN